MTESNAIPERVRGTRWLRFTGIFGIGLVIAAVLMVGIAQGGIAASFTVSGSQFKVSADHLRGSGFAQYGAVDRSSDGAHPVATNGFKSAQLDNFCQSVVVPGMPGVGDMSIKITAPGQNGMQAKDLLVNMNSLDADLQLNNTQIGNDASKLDKGPDDATGTPGTFGLQADSASLDRVRQVAWSTTAGTMKFTDMHLGVTTGRDECF